MEKISQKCPSVWLIYDWGKSSVEECAGRHLSPNDPNAVKVTCSDQLTTIIHRKWKISAYSLKAFEFHVVNQFFDLLHGARPLQVDATVVEKVGECAAKVGRANLADLLKLSLIADDYLSDRTTLSETAEELGKLELCKDERWKHIHQLLKPVSKGEDTRHRALHIYYCAGSPVLMTVAAKVLLLGAADHTLALAKACLKHANPVQFPHAVKILKAQKLTPDDLKSHIELLEQKAWDGDLEAQKEVADYYRNGGDTFMRFFNTGLFTHLACTQGDPDAHLQMSLDLAPYNPENSQVFLQQAADLNNAEAQLALAKQTLQADKPTGEKKEKALLLLLAAANQGLAEAQFWAAQCYEKGFGISKPNPKLALQFYQRAVEGGHAQAKKAAKRLGRKS